ncbi:MAG TPA: winged helix-turn-helix domain-containing protein [Terracidiphilus sp.]|jgi:DNA-binding winged helix-turn-helix (wHTH) protein
MDRFDPATAGTLETDYQFGDFRLGMDGTLSRGGVPVALPQTELAALRLLLACRGQVVTSLELKQAIWGDEPVPAESLLTCIASLRKKLEPEEYILTAKRGYRFTAEAKPLESGRVSGLPRLAIPPVATGYGVPEYLGSAIAEETTARLSAAQPATVSVLARDSVFALAERGLTPHQIGEQLGADWVLTAELHLISSHYRLRTRMIRVADGAEIWTEDRLIERTQLAGPELELVRAATFRIDGTGAGDTRSAQSGLSISASAERPQAPDPAQREAYETFARARYEWQSLERHRMQDALHHLLRAAELDPSLLTVRVNLAYLCVTQAFYGFMAPAVAAELTSRAADAIPDLPAGAETMLPALGWIRFHFDRDLPGALRLFARSAHLPHDPWITRARTLLALSRHRFGEAIEQLQAAIRVDPWSAWLQARLAWAHHLSGETSLGLQLAQTALERFPQHEGAQLYGAILLAFEGENRRALELAHRLTQRLPYFDPAAAVHAYALAKAGRGDEARIILERLQWLGRERYVMNTFASAAYVALGEPEAALAELRAADERRCPWFFQMLADPRLTPLKERAEFQSMLGTLADMEADAERDPQR